MLLKKIYISLYFGNADYISMGILVTMWFIMFCLGDKDGQTSRKADNLTVIFELII